MSNIINISNNPNNQNNQRNLPKITIGTHLNLFEKISASILTYNNEIFTPDTRHQSFNALICICIALFNFDQSQDFINQNAILYTYMNINTIITYFKDLSLNCFNIPNNIFMEDNFNNYILSVNFQNIFLNKLYSRNPNISFIDDILVKHFGENNLDVKVPFENKFIFPFIKPVNNPIEEKKIDPTILNVESIFMDRYKLKRLLSKKESVEVWLVEDMNFRNNEKVLKIINPEMFQWLKNAKGKEDELVKTNLLEYQNLKKLKAFEQYTTTYPYAGYSTISKKVYLVSDYFHPLNLSSLPSKPALLMELFNALLKLHEIGYCYNNLRPEHILFDNNGKLKLVDFKRISPPGEPFDLPLSPYNSLSALNGNVSSIYNDFESLVYIWEVLKNESELQLKDLNQDKADKQSLEKFDQKCKNAILKLRSLKQGGNAETEGVALNQFGENVNMNLVHQIFYELVSDNELDVPQILDENVPAHILKLSKTIKMNMISSGLFSNLNQADFDTMALRICYYVQDMITYSPEHQMLIDQFLNN